MPTKMDIFAKLRMNFKRARTFLAKGDINSAKAGVGYMENVAEQIEALIDEMHRDIFFDRRYKELEDRVPLFYYEVRTKAKEVQKLTKKKKDRDFHYCQNGHCPNDNKVPSNPGGRKLYQKKDMYRDSKTGLVFCSKECYKLVFEA